MSGSEDGITDENRRQGKFYEHYQDIWTVSEDASSSEYGLKNTEYLAPQETSEDDQVCFIANNSTNV